MRIPAVSGRNTHTERRDNKDFAVFIDTGSGIVLEQLDLREYELF